MSTILRLISSTDGIEAICTIRHPFVKGDQNQDWHIKQLSFYVNQEVVADWEFGPSISNDPVFSIVLDQLNPNDRVSVFWIDSRSYTGYTEARLR